MIIIERIVRICYRLFPNTKDANRTGFGTSGALNQLPALYHIIVCVNKGLFLANELVKQAVAAALFVCESVPGPWILCIQKMCANCVHGCLGFWPRGVVTCIFNDEEKGANVVSKILYVLLCSEHKN